jgi:hypothetical protein
MDSRFARITAAAGRRPLLTLAIAALLSFGGALAAVIGLQASTSTDTLIDKSSGSFDATNKYRDLFGGDPVVIMAKGDLRHTVETSDLGRLLQLEVDPASVSILVTGPPPRLALLNWRAHNPAGLALTSV